MATLLLVVGLTVLPVQGCGEDTAKVKGWPRLVPTLESDPTGGLAPTPTPGPLADVPPRPVLTDVRGALAATSLADMDEDVGPSDAESDSEVVVIQTWVGMSSCDRVVETACAYLGVYSDECAEVRGRQRPPQTNEVLSECLAILDQFDMTYNRPGIRRVRNPCWSLSYDICRDYGRTSDECAESKATARRMRGPSKRQACKGAIILYEARNVFPESGPLRSPNSPLPPPKVEKPKPTAAELEAAAKKRKKRLKKERRKRRRKAKRAKAKRAKAKKAATPTTD